MAIVWPTPIRPDVSALGEIGSAYIQGREFAEKRRRKGEEQKRREELAQEISMAESSVLPSDAPAVRMLADGVRSGQIDAASAYRELEALRARKRKLEAARTHAQDLPEIGKIVADYYGAGPEAESPTAGAATQPQAAQGPAAPVYTGTEPGFSDLQQPEPATAQTPAPKPGAGVGRGTRLATHLQKLLDAEKRLREAAAQAETPEDLEAVQAAYQKLGAAMDWVTTRLDEEAKKKREVQKVDTEYATLFVNPRTGVVYSAVPKGAKVEKLDDTTLYAVKYDKDGNVDEIEYYMAPGAEGGKAGKAKGGGGKSLSPQEKEDAVRQAINLARQGRIDEATAVLAGAGIPEGYADRILGETTTTSQAVSRLKAILGKYAAEGKAITVKPDGTIDVNSASTKAAIEELRKRAMDGDPEAIRDLQAVEQLGAYLSAPIFPTSVTGAVPDEVSVFGKNGVRLGTPTTRRTGIPLVPSHRPSQ